MALIVQKYGGTSVGTVDRIQNVAAKIKEQWSKGNRLVVVVSARSGVTNDLIGRAKALMPLPDEREMDVLMAVGEQETIALTVMALHAIGVPAVSRTGAQAGIFTDDVHTRARITRISGGDLLARLDEGKVVVVDFWATWCGPCVQEVPNLVKAYENLHSKGFEIVGVSLDQDKAKLEGFTKEKGMTWPQFFDGKGWQNEISSRFGIQSIPAMWLINKKGMLVSTNARPKLKDQVEKLLAE